MKQASVTRGFFILSRTNLIIKLISIIYVPVLLAIIGPAGHGDYALAYVYYGALVTLLSDAITKTMIRRVSALEVRGESDEAIRFTRSARQLMLGMSLGLAVLVGLLSRSLSELLHAPQLRLSLIILGISLVAVSLAAVYRAYFQASRKMAIAGNALIIEHLINAGLTIGLSWALLSRGMMYTLAGAAAGTLIGGIVSLIYLNQAFQGVSRGVTGQFSWEIVFQLIRPLLGISLILQVGQMLDALIIKQRLAGLGLDQVGASVAYSDITSYKMALSIPMILLSALVTALYPAITESVTRGDIQRFTHRISEALRHSYVIVLPAAAGIALVGRELNGFAFDGRLQREQLMIAAAFMVLPMSIAMIQQVILQADGRMVVSQLPLVVSIVVQVVASLVLIREPFYLIGAVLSGYFGIFSLVLANHVLLHRRHVSLPYIRHLGKPLVATIIMSAGLITLKMLLPQALSRTGNLLQMLLLVIVGGVIYALALLTLKGVYYRDLEMIQSGLSERLPQFVRNRLVE